LDFFYKIQNSAAKEGGSRTKSAAFIEENGAARLFATLNFDHKKWDPRMSTQSKNQNHLTHLGEKEFQRTPARRVVAAICTQLIVAATAAAQPLEPNFAALRARMVAEDLAPFGIKNPRVLDVMRKTPRHEFVLPGYRQYAYFDSALPIGERQTISPPVIVAYMTQQLDPQPTDRILEIGTGSGYQAAVLSPLVKEVYSIEIVPALGQRAAQRLRRLGYKNVFTRIGDGFKGWPEKAPFDKIIVTCSPEKIPQPLVDQLREGGQMIIPVGERYEQNLTRVTKRHGKLERETLQATLFVPMTGEAEASRRVQPDPLHPAIHNGGFEELLADTDRPAGWHYLRMAKVTSDGKAPEGKRWLHFENKERGRTGEALQGFPVDGRAVSHLQVSCQVQLADVQAGPDPTQLPALFVAFYDERRAAIDSVRLGPWTTTFPWRQETLDVRVPLAAREAILTIGLNGATGRMDVDDVRLAPGPTANQNPRPGAPAAH
jgi:protein-L-isoaspartate(D-aspartate) O-methyltransferase